MDEVDHLWLAVHCCCPRIPCQVSMMFHIRIGQYVTWVSIAFHWMHMMEGSVDLYLLVPFTNLRTGRPWHGCHRRHLRDRVLLRRLRNGLLLQPKPPPSSNRPPRWQNDPIRPRIPNSSILQSASRGVHNSQRRPANIHEHNGPQSPVQSLPKCSTRIINWVVIGRW